MTTLSEIRDLETRLHSHILEWSDVPLQNELLYLLDELQELHDELNKRDVPQTGADGLELTLRQRILWKQPESPTSDVGQPYQGPDHHQLAMFERPYEPIELHVRQPGDLRPWKDIAVEADQILCNDPSQAERLVLNYAHQYLGTDWQEIRWNWLGSMQGHYIPNHLAERIPIYETAL